MDNETRVEIERLGAGRDPVGGHIHCRDPGGNCGLKEVIRLSPGPARVRAYKMKNKLIIREEISYE